MTLFACLQFLFANGFEQWRKYTKWFSTWFDAFSTMLAKSVMTKIKAVIWEKTF